MILKIERHNNDQDWWLLDNIAKISCSHRRHHTRTVTYGLLGEDNFFPILDHEPDCSCSVDEGEGCSNCIPYYRLVCITKEYNEFSVCFDTIAYICNDDGKTIEKIVANYPERLKSAK